jgi:hypothetical protein
MQILDKFSKIVTVTFFAVLDKFPKRVTVTGFTVFNKFSKKVSVTLFVTLLTLVLGAIFSSCAQTGGGGVKQQPQAR